uniref:RNase H type-1 domain-containing protein n=1 Tax=Cannabis sativa TaxID=3483 RepID=A0A803PQK6_CANSA
MFLSWEWGCLIEPLVFGKEYVGVGKFSRRAWWRIGNGREARVWEDKWMPSPSGTILLKKPELEPQTKLHDLINSDGQWQIDKLQKHFHEEDIPWLDIGTNSSHEWDSVVGLDLHDLPRLRNSKEQTMNIDMKHQQPKKWIRPPTGHISVNCDAAMTNDTAGVGTGFIWRDWEGNLLLAGMVYHQSCCSVEMVEAWAILEALKHQPHTANMAIEIQSDCKKIVDEIQHRDNKLSAACVSSVYLNVKRKMASSNSMASLASEICNQISSIFSKPSSHPPVLDILVNEISSAVARNGRVFLYGVGREGLMLKALCMRLFHLGVFAHFVFDMTTPPIHGPQDLLISSAGPGGFSTVDALCSIARSNGARVLLLTAQPDTGSCVKHASVVGHVAAQTMADDESVNKSRPLLLMGSAYEGALFVLFEMAVYRLGEELKQSPELIRNRHTNLE